MGYRDSDDSGFSRHGMNRDNDHHDPLQHQRSQRVGLDHPELDRDEDLRTSHSIPGDSRSGRYAPYGGRRDGQGAPGARSWEGRSDFGRDFDRDRYQGQGGGYRSNHDSGYGYGARSPDIGGYGPYEAEQRFRQQQYGGSQYGGGYGQDDHARLTRPDAWAREGYGNYGSTHGGHERDQDGGYAGQRGRSYGYGYDGRPDARQGGYGGGHDRQQQGNPLYRSSQREHHDPDYSAWRQEQLRLLDEDYDSWRNERYQKFSDEFNTWRSARTRDEGLRSANPSDQASQNTPARNPQGSGTQSAGTTGAASGKTKE